MTRRDAIQNSRARRFVPSLKMLIPPLSVAVHILHDNTLTADNREKFFYLAGRYNQTVNFYNVEELCADELEKFSRLIPFIKSARTTIGTFYKFLIMYVLPKEIEKVIYLDADIIVNLDIKELWQVELGDKPLGAVPVYLQDKNKADGINRMRTGFNLPRLGLVKEEDYFNAGVFVMNLKRLRNEEEKILGGMKFRGEHPEFLMFDQCIWNYCFSKEYLKLPIKFNREVVEVRTQDGGLVERKIYHFTADNSLWSFGLDMNDALNRLWMNYFIKTPWFDSSTFGRLHEAIQQLCTNFKRDMANLSSLMVGKTRAFFTLPQNIEGIKKYFLIREDEEIIRAENQASLQKLLDAMSASRGRKIFFIIVPNFPFQALIQAGFVYGRDFFNGIEFFSKEQGVPFDSHKLIKSM